MRRSRGSLWIEARLFALPAARVTAAIAAGVALVALLAGVVRLLPLMLAPDVPIGVAPVLARGALAVALEAALFVAPPIGWAIAASRLVDRGEARALFAAGISPIGVIARSAPAMLAVLAAAAIAASSWGREARAPGRAARDLLAAARAACVAAAPPAAADVPLLGVSWICLAGESPRVIGPAPLHEGASRGVLAASALAISDDLATIEATDLVLLLPTAAAGAEARIHVGSASIRGISPIARASNLPVGLRAAVLSLSAGALAALASLIALRRAISSRVVAAILGAAGPLAALLVFSALERAPSPHAARYLAVPLTGIVAIGSAATLARFIEGRRP